VHHESEFCNSRKSCSRIVLVLLWINRGHFSKLASTEQLQKVKNIYCSCWYTWDIVDNWTSLCFFWITLYVPNCNLMIICYCIQQQHRGQACALSQGREVEWPPNPTTAKGRGSILTFWNATIIFPNITKSKRKQEPILPLSRSCWIFCVFCPLNSFFLLPWNTFLMISDLFFGALWGWYIPYLFINNVLENSNCR
jgi:hypothetical protein